MTLADARSVVAGRIDSALPTLQLSTLGHARLVRRTSEGEQVLYDGATKTLALFTYLACAPGRGATRTHLQDLLWERQGTEEAQGALRTYIWKLRKLLGADALTGDEYLVLAAPCDVDRDRLIEAADRGDAESVVALYHGVFFPAFALPDSPQFDLWVQGERLRLHGIYSRCAERVVSSAIDSGRFRDALGVARRLRDADPLDETGWRLLLNVLVVSGDSLNAGNEAAVLERLLAADEREPLPATLALLNAAKRGPRKDGGVEAPAPALVAPLVSRNREFTILTTSWARARARSFTHVHVRGPAGMGKTRLLDDFASRLQRDKTVVARARADMGRRDLPYAFVGSIVTALAGRRGAKGVSPGSEKALLAINPALSSYFPGDPDTAIGDEALRRRTLAFNELLVAISEEQPLALILDDLQWADSASCAVLAGAVAPLENAPCLLVTASREAPSPALAAVLGATIVLAPLDCDGVTELVQSLAALPDDAWAQALPSLLHRTTSGIPLHVLDALVLSLERGVLARDGQSWHSPAPDKLEQLLEQGATLPRRIEGLSREERTILLVLAVAGEPCTRERLREVLARTPMNMEHVLAMLERAGYVTASDERCALAHDTMTDAVLALASGDDRKRVHADLAMVELDAAHKQGDALAQFTLRSAIAHALRSDEDDALRAVFRAYVSRARKGGDARPLSRIASDALGDADSPAVRARLISVLRRRQRLLQGMTNRWMLLAGGAVLAVFAGLSGAWLATRTPMSDPDGELVFMRAESAGEARLYALPVSAENWVPGSPIEADAAKPFLTLPNDPMLMSAVPTVRKSGEWVGTLMQPDSGVTDLFLFAPGMPPKRLTAARGDDIEPSVSPDGQQVVFASARWSALAARSLAILDLNTGVVSRLTDDAGSDGAPSWSPDGRRIAFARTTSDGVRLCLVNTDGLHTVCPTPPQPPSSVRPWAWRNDSILLIDLSGQLVRAHVDSGMFSMVDTTRATRSVSADGRWLVTARPAPSGSGSRCEVSPASSPASARPLEPSFMQGVQCGAIRWSAPPPLRRHYIDALFIERTGSDPVVGVPHRFTARALDAQRDTSAIRHVDWSSSDTTMATVDNDGVLRPRKPGAITVRASYGGWRRAERRIDIRMPGSRVLLHEPWTDSLTRRWSPFGDPRPRVVETHDGERAFLNNGDGVFQSGAHTIGTFSMRNGLALDTWLSTPITMEQWQVVRLGLYGGVDSVGLAQWNHRDGWAFAPGRQHVYSCEFHFPSGPEGMRSFATRYTTAWQQRDAPVAWRKNGDRFRLRLQVFPDGRCGAAIDGRAVATGGAWPATAGGTAHVFLYGNSPGTRMLVGTVMVTEGVPPGVDWFAVDSAVAEPRMAGVARPIAWQGKRRN